MKSFSAIGKDTSFQPFAPTCCDGYKIGHASLYPKGTDFAYGNGTPRSDRLFQLSNSMGPDFDHKVVWVGVQGALREIHGLWQRTFFGVPKEEAIARYKRRMSTYLGDPEINASYLSDLHDLGYLPVTVLSIKEGERLNMNVPGYVIYAFGKHFWIVNYLETIFSDLLWKSVNDATIAYEFRRVIDGALADTGAPTQAAMFLGHDFSFRGLNGIWDAATVGFAHLTSFAGSDTLPAMDFAEQMYGADSDSELVSASVMATEHAVTTANILYEAKKYKAAMPSTSDADARTAGELAFIKRAITEVKPSGIISLVSDSFDYWTIISKVFPALKSEILARTPDALGNAKVVIRPDSGDPVDVICGLEVFTSEEVVDYDNEFNNPHALSRSLGGLMDRLEKDVTKKQHGLHTVMQRDMILVTHAGALFRAYKASAMDEGMKLLVTGYVGSRALVPTNSVPLTPEEKGSIEVLWETFNGTITTSGYKVLHERVGLIYGDSITVARAVEIFRRLKKKGFAANNVVFGIGSYTYQYSTRDSFGFAVKATAIGVDGDLIQLFKAPKTEGDTMKKSAKGLLRVVKQDGNFVLEQGVEMELDEIMDRSGELKPVYSCGEFMNQTSLAEIRSQLHPNFYGA